MMSYYHKLQNELRYYRTVLKIDIGCKLNDNEAVLQWQLAKLRGGSLPSDAQNNWLFEQKETN